MNHFLDLCNHTSPAFRSQLRVREREMLPYVDTPYVSVTSPAADQERVMNSSITSSLVSPYHGHHPAAAFSSFPWFPLSPFAFDQGLVFPMDEEAAHIVEEELNESPDVAPLSDPPAAGYMAEINAVAATAADPQAATDAAEVALPEEKKNNGKKRFRTDRHSKIRTSQGLRDRRMRLSLDVARQFFDLQDTLGFDKASQTISWLLTQSKAAIAQLTTTRTTPRANRQAFNSPHSSFGSNNSSSECEAFSPNPQPPSGGSQPLDAVAPDAKSAKEYRNKARARTREKNQKRINCKNLFADASTLDYQPVAPSKTSTAVVASGSGAGAADDRNFEAPASWNGRVAHSPIATIPSGYLWSNHEAVNFMEEELKIADSGTKNEDTVISWLM